MARDGAVMYRKLDPPLRRAVLLHWGSMTAARKALGLRAPSEALHWTRKRVIDEIIRLAQSGQHMSCGALIKAGHGKLLLAATRYVGSWVRARTIAGIRFKPHRAFRPPRWDAAAVVASIQDRHLRELPLASSKVPAALLSAAVRIFGSWREAIKSAGIDYDAILIVRPVSDGEMLAWLRALARENPDMTLNELAEHPGYSVSCRRRWGSIEAAVCAAGITGWPLRIRRPAMSRSAVLRALRAWNVRKNPLSLGKARQVEGGHYLINSVFHHFSSWNDGLAAAGLRK